VDRGRCLSFHTCQALTSSPVLILPDFAKPFEVVCDACRTPPVVGAVLLQVGRPVAYYSRKLSGAELSYSVSDIEMLAVISALQEWRCYLEEAHAPFTLVTDHQPNVYLDSATNAHTVHRRARWLSASCGYNYKWCYRPGRDNVADPISRAPQHFAHICSLILVAGCVEAMVVAQETIQLVGPRKKNRGPSDLVQHCVAQRCSLLCAAARVLRPRLHAGRLIPPLLAEPRNQYLSRYFAGGSDAPRAPATRVEAEPLSPKPWSTGVVDYSDVHQDQQQEVSNFLKDTFFKRVRQGYTKHKASASAVCSGRLHVDAQGLQWTSNEQLFIPHWDNLRYECFESVHKHLFSGHFGAQRTLKKATQLYSWPNMARDIQTWVNQCDSCQQVNAVRKQPVG
jgi:hypothetical protein